MELDFATLAILAYLLALLCVFAVKKELNRKGRKARLHTVSSTAAAIILSCFISLFSLSFRQAERFFAAVTMKTASALLPALLVCLCLTGCSYWDKVRNTFKPRDALPSQAWTSDPMPTLEKIISGVNQNSQSIRNFSTENASIYIPGVMIPLHSRITFERPKRMRIQGSATSLGSREFDFGSNDELFWLWMRRNEGVMWFCRHDQYPLSPVREYIPMDPEWLIEALGIVEFKPRDQHFGPTRLDNGNWEIISHCQTPSGQFIRRTVFDHKTGLIVQQELYTPQYALAAMAQVTDYRLDRGTGIYYAKRVEVQCQGMTGKMTIDLGSPTFNRLEPFSSTMFVMPEYPGYRALDLCGPEVLQQRGVVMPPPAAPVSEANIQTVIR